MHKMLNERPEGKRQRGRPRHKKKCDIKIETRRGGNFKWINMPQYIFQPGGLGNIMYYRLP
jgi:hypothetical protein